MCHATATCLQHKYTTPEPGADSATDVTVAVQAQACQHALKRQLIRQRPADVVVREVHLTHPRQEGPAVGEAANKLVGR